MLGKVKEKTIREKNYFKIVIKRSINLGKNQTNKAGTSLINFLYVFVFIIFFNVIYIGSN